MIAGEIAGLPFLPEMPGRGAGADLVGRTGALLADVSADLNLEPIPTGWRLAGAPTRTMRLARAWLGEDQDLAQEHLGDSPGAFKLQLAGPWTLAAGLETARGTLALGDPGLVREIAAALVVAAESLLRDMGRRLPNRSLWIQFDEPSLPGVLRGSIPTASGYSRFSAVPVAQAAETLVGCARAGSAVLHCCADFPFEAAQKSGFAGISLDLTKSPQPWRDEGVGSAVEAGVALHAGVLPALPDLRQTSAEAPLDRLTSQGWQRLESLWSRTGLEAEQLKDVVVTQSCGMAGATWPQVRAAFTAANQIAKRCHTR